MTEIEGAAGPEVEPDRKTCWRKARPVSTGLDWRQKWSNREGDVKTREKIDENRFKTR